MMVTLDLKDLTKDLAEHIALSLINEMIDFANGIQKVNPEAVYMYPLMEIEELRERLRSDRIPLRSENEVDVYFNRLTQITINHRPSVRRQLQSFFDAHTEKAKISHEKGIFYNPHHFIEANRINIERVAEMEGKVIEQYDNNRNDETTIYALLFIHIQNTETVAKSMINQLRDMLKIGGLLSKYDPGEIFAVDQFFKVKNKKKIITITDGQAIRHALAHNLFEVVFTKSGWEIHFNNTKGRGYTFQRKYTGDQFVESLTRSAYLYRASYILLIRIIGGTIIKLRLVR